MLAPVLHRPAIRLIVARATARDTRGTKPGYASLLQNSPTSHFLTFHGSRTPQHNMAATPRYVMSSDNESYAESSPDPLGASFDEDRERAHQPTATRTPKQRPLAASSPSKQNRRSTITDIDISSPAKQMLLSTPRTGGQSPWRIRVTVQAEPGSDSENLESPIVKHITHTKTTKVPLKDPDASSPVKRRGRPRKSDSPTKRSGTPVRKRTSSKTRRKSVEDNSAADTATDGTPKRKRGRPRKTQPFAEDDIWGQARRESIGADASAADVETDATPKKRRGRPRKSIQPRSEDEPAHIAEGHTSPASPTRAIAEPGTLTDAPSATHIEDETLALAMIKPPNTTEKPMPTSQRQNPRPKSPTSQPDMSPKVNASKSTPLTKDKILIEISSGEESDSDSDIEDHQQYQVQGAAGEIQHIEPEQAPSIRTEDADGEEPDEIDFAFDDEGTRMPDDTTVIDSESFSMISVDSLPSCTSIRKPTNGPARLSVNAPSRQSAHNHNNLNTTTNNLHGKLPVVDVRSSAAPTHISLPVPQDPRSAQLRYKTPSEEPVELSIPPPLEPARLDLSEAQTPRIGRVVTAGVALQGVLDPSRVTPEAGSFKIMDERREHLDDLFRGFSERTRRELHAGLRLGEQLAKQSQSAQPSSPALSSSVKAMTLGLSTGDCTSSNTVPQQYRMLTPEDQPDDTAPAPQETDVAYPTLAHSDRSGLLSPVSNSEDDVDEEDRVNSKVDTPPVHVTSQKDTQFSDQRVAERSGANHSLDIWEEEASQSSVVSGQNNAPKCQDPFVQNETIEPTRSKVSRSWRKKTSDVSNHSGEAQVSEQLTPLSTETDQSAGSPAHKDDQYKGKIVQPSLLEDYNNDCDEEGQASDDTGVFFQANPLTYEKRSREKRRGRPQYLDNSLNLDESLLPESSPPGTSKTPVADKLNPFLNTPPHLAAFHSSPAKSSPLRRELQSSDLSSGSAHRSFEESTLPLPPSSPFHTYVDTFVDGDTDRSMGSDQRQLMHEMAGTDSSLRRIRVEADEYLDAYKLQERELEDLTEVTELSRTWQRDSTILLPSASKQVVDRRISESNSPSSLLSVDGLSDGKLVSTQQRTPTDLCTVTPTTASPPAHPALKKLTQLPRVEPWTKTHYKALDKLYQLYKKQPVIFSPNDAPNAALNTTLLTNILNSTTHNFIGARYRAWGYSVIFTEAILVLAAAFMQTLTLDDLNEYEERAGQKIQMGECAPGRTGEEIKAETVMERLATIILGEAVRRDEKKGKVVDKSGRLRVEWPE